MPLTLPCWISENRASMTASLLSRSLAPPSPWLPAAMVFSRRRLPTSTKMPPPPLPAPAIRSALRPLVKAWLSVAVEEVDGAALGPGGVVRQEAVLNGQVAIHHVDGAALPAGVIVRQDATLDRQQAGDVRVLEDRAARVARAAVAHADARDGGVDV